MTSNPDFTAVIDGDTKTLIQALEAATDQLKNFEAGTGQSLKRLDKTFTNAFGNMRHAVEETKTAIAAFAPIGIFNLLSDQLDKGIKDFRKIGDAADAAALSTDFFQALAYKAGEARIEQDKLAEGLKKFAENLAALKHGRGDLFDHLKENDKTLLSTLQNVKTVDDGIRALAERMQKSGDPVKQARLAIEAFGKEHQNLRHVLDDGTAGLTRAAEEARHYGVIISENVIRNSQDAKDGVAALSKTISAEFRQALLEVAPLLHDIAAGTLAVARGARQMHDAFQSSPAGLSDEGLHERIRGIAQNLAAYREEMARLDAGQSKLGDHSILKDALTGNYTDDELKADIRQKAEAALAEIKKFQDELDARKKQSADRHNDLAKDFFDNNGEGKDDKNAAQKLLEGQRAEEELMKRYYTDTHQFYEAIKADQEREAARFKMMLDDHKITWQRYQVDLILIAADANAKIKNEQEKLNTTLKDSMRGISSEFDKIFTSWQSGHAMTIQQIERDFVQMIERMILKAAILEPLFGTGMAGANQNGLIGGGIQSLFGGGGQAGSLGIGSALSGIGSSIGSWFSGIFHEGGIVGDGGPGRWVDSGVFEGATRYHEGGIAGLMPGEVPAILQQGEGVFTQEQMQAGGGRGGHTFITNIETPNPQAFGESHGQITAMLTQAVARGDRNL
jgi:hypothetical protein